MTQEAEETEDAVAAAEIRNATVAANVCVYVSAKVHRDRVVREENAVSAAKEESVANKVQLV